MSRTKIFAQNKNYLPNVKRNTFDTTHRRFDTFDFGKLYPIYVQETLPSTSVKISTTALFNFNPTQYPLLNDVKAKMYFFYCRNRNVDSTWMDFITNQKAPNVPYLANVTDKDTMTGSLLERLGLPSTASTGGITIHNSPAAAWLNSRGSFGISIVRSEQNASYYNGELNNSWRAQNFTANGRTKPALGFFNFAKLLSNVVTSAPTLPTDFTLGRSLRGSFLQTSIPTIDSTNAKYYTGQVFEQEIKDLVIDTTTAGYGTLFTLRCQKASATGYLGGSGATQADGKVKLLVFQGTNFEDAIMTHYYSGHIKYTSDSTTAEFRTSINNRVALQEYLNKVAPVTGVRVYFGIIIGSDATDSTGKLTNTPNAVSYLDNQSRFGFDSLVYSASTITETPLSGSNNPFLTSNENHIKIPAHLLRHYRSICNYYFRNQQNDPFSIDGVIERNKFTETTEGGADTKTPLTLYDVNWEQDFYVSALQQPQQGIAPLVGIESHLNSDSVTFKFANGDAEQGFENIEGKIDPNGNVTMVARTQDHSPEVEGAFENLKKAVLVGLNINTLRNVNALQTWLETNIRRGYKYAEVIKAHFGNDMAFTSADVPEYIGGATIVQNSNGVVNMSASGGAVLGDKTGMMSGTVTGSNTLSVDRYCDEHGFIIGLIAFEPTPVYSQELPMYFQRFHPLDYPSPEFSHIGYQPIKNKTLACVNAWNEGTSDKTFGYQRAWSEYMSARDQAHGDFRTILSPYLMSRKFFGTPVLGQDFIKVKAESLTDPFIITEGSQPIIGQFNFKSYTKHPLAEYGIPSLKV